MMNANACRVELQSLQADFRRLRETVPDARNLRLDWIERRNGELSDFSVCQYFTPAVCDKFVSLSRRVGALLHPYWHELGFRDADVSDPGTVWFHILVKHAPRFDADPTYAQKQDGSDVLAYWICCIRDVLNVCDTTIDNLLARSRLVQSDPEAKKGETGTGIPATAQAEGTDGAPMGAFSKQSPGPRISAVPSPGQLNSPVEIFFSYCHKDERLRDKLEKHVSLLKREGSIAGWHDRKIGAGTEWKGEIDVHLNSARIILLLVSAEFVASDYCYDVEMGRAMSRHEAGDALVIPIILRPCDWQSAPFGKLQALPKDAKPVADWKSQDHAFNDIARGIRAVVKKLNPKGRGIAMAPASKLPGTAPIAPTTGTGAGIAEHRPTMNGLSSAMDERSVALWRAFQAPNDVLRDLAAQLTDRMSLPVRAELEQPTSGYRLHRLMVGNRKLITVIQPPCGWPVRVEHQHADPAITTTWACCGPGHDPSQPPSDQHKLIGDANALADVLGTLTASTETRAILELARLELEGEGGE